MPKQRQDQSLTTPTTGVSTMVVENLESALQTPLTLKERIAERNELYQQLNNTSSEILKATRNLESKKWLAEAATRNLEDLKRQLAGERSGLSMEIKTDAQAAEVGYSLRGEFKENSLNPEQRERFSAMSNKSTTAAAEIVTASKDLQAMNEKKQSLMDKLSTLGDPLGEVLAFQDMLKGAEEKVSLLLSAIAGQEDIIRKATAGIPSFDGLTQRRQDILAEIATGKDMASALTELDEQIQAMQQEAAEAKSAAAKIVEDANNAIAGLKRKLVLAQEESKALQDQKKAVVIGFLTFEAEKAGADYARLAMELIGRFRQLLALDTFLTEAGAAGIYEGVSPSIPPFVLLAHQGENTKQWHCDGYGVESMLISTGLNFADQKAERHRISSLGITL